LWQSNDFGLSHPRFAGGNYSLGHGDSGAFYQIDGPDDFAGGCGKRNLRLTIINDNTSFKRGGSQSMIMPANKSLQPTPVGVGISAFAGCVTGPAWLSFCRWATEDV